VAFLSTQIGVDLAAARSAAGNCRESGRCCLRSAACDFLASPTTASRPLVIRFGERPAHLRLSRDAPAGSAMTPSEQKTPLYKKKKFLAGAVVVVAAAAILLASGGGSDPEPASGHSSLPGFPPPPDVR
jgi:hypothetical protein